MIVAEDNGPGIPDISLALQDGYSTSKSLGVGLPGAKRLMDEFEIDTEAGKGTVIKMIKWKHK
jgi:serine/threonine-protein kinase RsbT